MKLKKMVAALVVAATVTATAVPAMADDSLVTATNHFGVEYQIDYSKGAANIGGRRIYFGYTADSPRVKACGWTMAVGLQAAELADLMSYDPAWWSWFVSDKPTVEEWTAWHNGNK